jgi:hypothetical protein
MVTCAPTDDNELQNFRDDALNFMVNKFNKTTIQLKEKV